MSDAEKAASVHGELGGDDLARSATVPVDQVLPVPSQDPNDPLAGQMQPLMRHSLTLYPRTGR
jgi:hypothetical protein